MSDVKRYTLTAGIPAGAASLKAGSIVVAGSDYDALLAERDQLRAQVEQQMPRLIDENHQLRAELAAIRGQEPFGIYAERNDGEKLFRRTGEPFPPSVYGGNAWTLYALPPQQPDAVSVPRDLLERMDRFYTSIGDSEAWPELRALLSTRQAEEGE